MLSPKAYDAGNCSMRDAGRDLWNENDLDTALAMHFKVTDTQAAEIRRELGIAAGLIVESHS